MGYSTDNNNLSKYLLLRLGILRRDRNFETGSCTTSGLKSGNLKFKVRKRLSEGKNLRLNKIGE